MKTEQQNIQLDRLYSPTEIARNQLIPGIKSYPSVLKRILEDEAKPTSKRTIHATKVGEGRGTKYFIKGRNLLAYINAQAAK